MQILIKNHIFDTKNELKMQILCKSATLMSKMLFLMYNLKDDFYAKIE